jgi:hypothetical protein
MEHKHISGHKCYDILQGPGVLKIMTMWSIKSLQATGAAPSDLDGEGDSQLPGFVVVPFPAPVPEL